MIRTQSLQETIQARLASLVRESVGSTAVAESTIALMRQVALRLNPVIGEGGVEMLFRRTLYLSTRTSPWLGGPGAPDASALETLRAQLLLQDAEVAAAGGCAVLVTFVELLSSLIGAKLTEQLLSPVWDSRPAKLNQENGS